jgi:predicted RecB family nuclease
MPFSDREKELLLSVKGVGPKVVERLEAIGIHNLKALARQNTDQVCALISGMLGSTCWRNSPMARASISAAIAMAKEQKSMANA